MVLCGHRKLKSRKSRLREQSRRDACSVLCVGFTAWLLWGCRSDLPSTSSETRPENNPFFPHSGSSGPVNCKNHIGIRGSGIRCAVGLWEWGPTALQEHIRKQKFVSYGSVWMHSSCPSSSSWLPRLLLEWLKRRWVFC